jgi:hypothetical protein
MPVQTRDPTSFDTSSGTWSATTVGTINDYPDQTTALSHGTTAGDATWNVSAPTVPAGATNIVVRVHRYHGKGGGGPSNAAGRIKIGSNYFDGTPVSLSNNTIALYTEEWTNNPDTASPWTVSEANSIAAIGVFSTDANPTWDLYSVQLEIEYSVSVTYEKAGDASASLEGTGASQHTIESDGEGQTSLEGSGPDAIDFVETGVGVSAGVGSGASEYTGAGGNTYEKEGGATASLEGSGLQGEFIRLSSSIFVNGEPTTPQLTSVGVFQAGVITDDTNPVSLDLESNRYTEIEWALEASAQALGSYEFRVTVSGDPITYDQTPVLSISTAYEKTGGATASLQGSGEDEDTFVDIGQGTTSLEGAGSRALVFTKTGGAEAGLQGSGADEATYTESGDGVATPLSSGADEATLERTGLGTASLDSSSIDFVSYAKQGQGSGSLLGSGADVFEATESGVATSALVGSGPDVGEFVETSTGIATFDGSGAESSEFTESGGAEAPFVGSGEQSETNIYAKTGGAETSVVGSGVDETTFVETITGIAVLVGSGLSVYEPVQGITYQKEGGATCSLDGTGMDASEFVETITGSTALVGAGVKNLEYVESGLAEALFTGSGVKVTQLSSDVRDIIDFDTSLVRIFDFEVSLVRTIDFESNINQTIDFEVDL